MEEDSIDTSSRDIPGNMRRSPRSPTSPSSPYMQCSPGSPSGAISSSHRRQSITMSAAASALQILLGVNDGGGRDEGDALNGRVCWVRLTDTTSWWPSVLFVSWAAVIKWGISIPQRSPFLPEVHDRHSLTHKPSRTNFNCLSHSI